MPDYNLGRAHGTIRVDYEGDGAKRAQQDVRDVGDEATETATKIDQSTKKSGQAFQRLSRTARSSKVSPDVDHSAFERLVRQIQGIDKNTRRSVGLLNTFNSRLGIMTAGALIASPAVAGLGVSLVRLAGLAGIAAGALAGLGATAATLAVGLGGVSDVFKEASNQAKSAGSSAAASASQQRNAARAIESAKRSLADAEVNLKRVQEDAARASLDAVRRVLETQRDLTNAQRDAVRAQQSLVRAREEATRQLEDMRSALTGGALDERQAILDVQRAQEELAAVTRDPTASERERQQAILNLEKQQHALEQTRVQNQRLTEDQSRAAAAGVAGSEAVVSAQDQVRSSAQSVADAQQAVADATENVRLTQIESGRAVSEAVQQIIDAQHNLEDAYVDAAESATSAGSAMADAMSKLSPNARAFVSEVLGMQGAWEDLKTSVQDRLFEGLAAEVKPLANTWLPLLKDGMGDIADGLNGMAKETSKFLKSAEATDNVRHIFGNTSEAVGNLRFVLRDLIAAFLDIAAVGSDFLPDLATGAGNAAARFREFVHEARESGRLKEWMQEAIDTVKQLWQLLQNLGSIATSLFTNLDQSGGTALETLVNLTGKLADFLKTAEGKETIQDLGAALQAIGLVVGKVFLAALLAFGKIMGELKPLISSISDSIGVGLAGAFAILGPPLKLVADLLNFLSPVLGPIAAGIIVTTTAVKAAELAWRLLNTTMKANPFILIASLIIGLVILIIQNWDKISAFLSGVWEGIKNAAQVAWMQIHDKIVQPIIDAWNELVEVWNKIIDWLKSVWNNIIEGAKTGWKAVGDAIKNAVTSARDWVGQRLADVVRFFQELPGKILDFLKSLPGKLADWVGDLVGGIVRGLKNLAGNVINAFRDMISDAWDSVLDFFGISSPSRLAIWAAEQIGRGLVRGLDGMQSAVETAASNLADKASTALTGATGSLAAQVAVTPTVGALPGNLAMAGTVPLKATAAGTAAQSQRGGTTIVIDNLTLHVAGNLDPTNPTAFRQTIVRLKDALRSVDREYV